MKESRFTVAQACKLFSFQSYNLLYIFSLVWDLLANCTIILICSRELHCGLGPTTTKCVRLCVMDSREYQEL